MIYNIRRFFVVIQFICYWCTKCHASHERCLLTVSNPLCKVVWPMLWWVQYYSWNKGRGWPQYATWRKAPRQFEQGETPAKFAATPKDEYHWVYFEALDLATTSICSRFDQKGFKIFSNEQIHQDIDFISLQLFGWTLLWKCMLTFNYMFACTCISIFNFFKILYTSIL